MADTSRPITGPVTDEAEAAPLSAPRLARHTFTLSDGHRIGLAVCGKGVPLVVVHGFTAEGFLYAQTLNRLVRKGFKVVAIDVAGHGGTQGLPATFSSLGRYAELMSQCIDELGIRYAVLAGHSMGGRIAAQVGATHPEKTVAVLLIDAIVGDEWDRMVNIFRVAPPLLAALGVALVADTVSTLPVVRNPSQAAKLWRLLAPTAVGHVIQPWRLVGPGYSILASPGSRWILEELAAEEVPTVVITGDRDVIVPPCTAASAARRASGELVRVHNAGHSWLLRDPETLPAIVEELLDGSLGAAIREAIHAAGAGSVEDLESIFLEPDAPVLALTPDLDYTPLEESHRRPAYRWTIT